VRDQFHTSATVWQAKSVHFEGVPFFDAIVHEPPWDSWLRPMESTSDFENDVFRLS